MLSPSDAEACITAKQLLDFAAAEQQPGNPLGAASLQIGATVAVRLTALPETAPYNKARAFGQNALTGLEEIEAFYVDAALPSRIEVSADDPDHARVLAKRGYRPGSSALTMACEVAHGYVVTSGGSVTEVESEADDSVYLEKLLRGYELVPGSAQAQMLAVEHRTPGLRRFVAIDGGEPAAAGALFVEGRVGYLAGAATAPGHRRRGHQLELINARMETAAEEGLDDLVVTVSRGTSSHANLMRAGFTEVQTRQVWELPRSP